MENSRSSHQDDSPFDSKEVSECSKLKSVSGGSEVGSSGWESYTSESEKDITDSESDNTDSKSEEVSECSKLKSENSGSDADSSGWESYTSESEKDMTDSENAMADSESDNTTEVSKKSRQVVCRPKFRYPSVTWRRSGRKRMPTSMWKPDLTPPRRRPSTSYYGSSSRENLETRGRPVERCCRFNLPEQSSGSSCENLETRGRSRIRRSPRILDTSKKTLDFFLRYSL